MHVKSRVCMATCTCVRTRVPERVVIGGRVCTLSPTMETRGAEPPARGALAADAAGRARTAPGLPVLTCACVCSRVLRAWQRHAGEVPGTLFLSIFDPAWMNLWMQNARR